MLSGFLLTILSSVHVDGIYSKYSHFDYDKLYYEFEFCLPCIDILIYCGFERKKTNNGLKLIFNPQKSQKLIETKELFQLEYNQFAVRLVHKKTPDAVMDSIGLIYKGII